MIGLARYQIASPARLFAFTSPNWALVGGIVGVTTMVWGPWIRLSGTRVGLDDLVGLLAAVVYLTANARSLFSRQRPDSIMLRAFCIMALCMVLSIAYSGVFLRVEFSISDLLEPVKLAKYLGFFALGRVAMQRGLRFSGMVVLVGATTCSAALFGIAQRINLFDVNQWLSPIYASPSQIHQLTSLDVRVLGPMGNPNEFAMYLLLGGVFLVAATSALPWTGLVRRILTPLLALIGVAFLLAQSRTSFVALFVSLVVYGLLTWILSMRDLKNWRNASWMSLNRFIGGLALIIGILLAMRLFPHAYVASISKFATASYEIATSMPDRPTPPSTNQHDKTVEPAPIVENAFESSGSVQGRLEMWQSALARFKQSPFFGWGPAKSEMPRWVDGEYVLTLRRYGTFGLAAWLILFLSPAVLAVRSIKNQEYDMASALAMGVGLQVIVVLVSALTESILTALNVLPLLWFCVGGLVTATALRHRTKGQTAT